MGTVLILFHLDTKMPSPETQQTGFHSDTMFSTTFDFENSLLLLVSANSISFLNMNTMNDKWYNFFVKGKEE